MDLQEVEFANEAFYLAFEGKDIQAMEHLWSAEVEIVCLHPGWPALVGREAVIKSWRDILRNPQQGQVSFFNPTVHRVGADAALVVCYERAGDAVMIASNLFVQEGDGLRLVSHHAGQCAYPPEAE
ncbi:MAG: nuclear transport factor 2 family protein [Pseudomonadota bacterium]